MMVDMLEADIQTVLTDAVWPSLMDCEDDHTPIWPPKSTTPNLPVHGPLTLPTFVKVGVSWEIARVPVPTLVPTVDMMATDPRVPEVLLHKTVVSDLHALLSHAVAPFRTAPVIASCANPCPKIETLEPPVKG